ncbi:MAG: tetratricopeptide repeat protein [Candidatus Omnitrophota bacterium]|nr:tetratricopeptide repeat protein [Candidatus Omnitrophota bacterium]
MEAKDRDYILKHIGKRSIREIAADLHIKERKVRKFIKSHKESGARPVHAGPVKERHFTPVVSVFLILIVILTIVVYSNALTGEFLLDDPTFVRDNINIRSLTNLPKFFFVDVGVGGGVSFGYYRPIQMIFYTIIYHFWELNVQPYHLLNILLHVMVVLSVYWMIKTLYGDDILSIFVTSLYSVHPVHAESVTYISGTGDCLVGFFMLISFTLYVKQQRTNSILVYSALVLSYLMALFSKENSLILPALFLLYHIAFRVKVKIVPFLSLIALTFIYLAFRMHVLKSSDSVGMTIPEILQRVPGFFAAIAGYMYMLFLPFTLNMGHDSRIFQLTEPSALLGLLILIILIVSALLARRRYGLIFFGIFWFFITLMPVANLYNIACYMADHYLYLPSIGIFLIAGKGLRMAYDDQKFRMYALICLTLLIGFYSFMTFKQNQYWRDPTTFFEWILRHNPESFRTLNNLGREYEKKKMLESAKELYKRAVAANPLHKEAYNNLGNIYFKLGNDEEAIKMYKKQIEVNPKYANAYNNLGNAYARLNNNEEAIRSYKKVLELKLDRAGIYTDLGTSYAKLGNSEEAINMFRKAIEADPRDANAYNNMGNVNGMLGKDEEAMSLYRKAIEANPDFMGAYSNLGRLAAKHGRTEEAIAVYTKAAQRDPGFTKAYEELTVLYYNAKQFEAAIRYHDLAIRHGGAVPQEVTAGLEPYRSGESV